MDFAQSCILIAAFLVAISISGYRLIALVMLINFIAHDLMAYYVLIALDGAKSWPLHALNILISGLTIIILVKLGANKYLYSAIFIYALYNHLVLCEFIMTGIGFHANYVLFARVQMIFELLYMILFSEIGRYACNRIKPSNNYRYLVDRIFADRFGMGLKRLA